MCMSYTFASGGACSKFVTEILNSLNYNYKSVLVLLLGTFAQKNDFLKCKEDYKVNRVMNRVGRSRVVEAAS